MSPPRPLPEAAELELRREVVTTHHELVYRLAYRVLRNRADAEDATQEVFVQLLRTTTSLRSITSLRSWVARIALNTARKMIRGESNRRRREEAWATTKAAAGAGGESTSPAGDSGADLEAVTRALQALPDGLAIPVALYFQEGFKYREIASALECPEGTIAKRIHTAKMKLRESLVRSGALPAMVPISVVERLLTQAPPIPVPETLAARLAEAAAAELGAATAAAKAAASAARATFPLRTAALWTLAALIPIAGVLVLLNTPSPSRDAARDTAVARHESVSAAGANAPDARDIDRRGNAITGSPTHEATATTTELASAREAPTDTASSLPGADPLALVRLFGVVTDEAGRAVPDATVAARFVRGSHSHVADITDENGAYEILFPRPPTRPAGHGDEASVAFEGSPVITLGEEQLSEDKDLEVAGELSIAIEGALEPSSESESDSAATGLVFKTDSSGFAMLPEHEVEVRITADTYAADRMTVAAPPPGNPAVDELELDLELAPGFGISGRVTDDAGQPATDARVEIVAYTGRAREIPAEQRVAIAGPGGLFEYGQLPDGHYVLRATQPSRLTVEALARAGANNADIQLGDTGGSLRVVLPRPSDSSDDPTAIHEVRVWAPRGYLAASAPANDPDAELLFETLRPADYAIQLIGTDDLVLATQHARVETGQETVALFEPPPLVILEGKLNPPTGIPATVYIAEVTRTPAKTDAGLPESSASVQLLVNAAGEFRTALPPGHYSIAATPMLMEHSAESGIGSAFAEVTLEAQAPPCYVQLEPRVPADCRVECRVTDGDANPIAGAGITVRRLPGKTWRGFGVTDSLGNAVIAVEAGPHEVIVTADGYREVCTTPVSPGTAAPCAVHASLERDERQTCAIDGLEFPAGIVVTTFGTVSFRSLVSLLNEVCPRGLQLAPEAAALPDLDRPAFDYFATMPPDAALEHLVNTGGLRCELVGEKLVLLPSENAETRP